ncbi:MAG: (4Fe-4S)-binding protein [bacterium]|nr:MAG: (4Fe-4S)-binding protein [bacterium]
MDKMKTRVALAACADYDPQGVKESIIKMIDSLGGIGRFVGSGDKVLLKPNMLTPSRPEQAVITHPAVVRAVAEIVMDCGGKPFIADSPGSNVNSFKRLARLSGLSAVAKELGIPIFPLDEPIEKRLDEKKMYRILEISRHVLEADTVINLPKLKTHVMMYMTVGVKNIFGCVVGKRKAGWHLNAGIDHMFFARMLVELYDAVAPALTIMDGILAMEGNGPGTSGNPRQCGVMAAAVDAVALDRVAVELVGAKPERLHTSAAAREMGIGETDIRRIEITGESVEKLRIENFVFPKKSIDMMPIPNIIRRLLNDHLTSKPKEIREKCTLCDQCVDICPTGVISKLGDKLEINYDSCIRCFCCVEVCPEGAMKPIVPWLLKLVG